MTEDKTVKGILHGVPVTVTIKGKPDYTPTTEEVRDAATTDYREEDITQHQFDRWLAEVKAKAWEKGFQGGHDSAMGVSNTKNPYRQDAK